jgi:outer membrane protein assembly factor BamB
LKLHMRERRLPPLFLLLALGALTLTSCGGGLPAASWFGIAASEDTVYLAANEQVLALNLESGAELWAFPPEPDKKSGPFYAPPLLTEEVLVVGGFGDGKLYAISQDAGTQEWAVETEGAIVEGAVFIDDGIIVANNEGEVYLVGVETQEKRILLKAAEPIWATPLVDEVHGRVYVASMDHHLYAVELESGQQLWAFEADGALTGTPALSDGVLYFGALNNTFYAVDAEAGAELWSVPTEGWVWGGPLVQEGTIFFGDLAGKLYALNATDGSERWPTFEAEGGIRATPVLVDGLLYFGTRQGRVYAVKAEDGTQQWSLSLAGSVFSQPVIRGDYLLVSPHNAKVQLVALDKSSGAERWSYPRREE